MNERTCGNCRWWRRLSDAKNNGECCRYPAVPVGEHFDRPTPSADWGCSEWADKTSTPEQEQKRELVRRFAVAIVSAGLGEHFADQEVWVMANRLADAEPKQ